MKRAAPKRKPRTFKVWVYLPLMDHIKTNGASVIIAKKMPAGWARATLTLSGGKGKGGARKK